MFKVWSQSRKRCILPCTYRHVRTHTHTHFWCAHACIHSCIYIDSHIYRILYIYDWLYVYFTYPTCSGNTGIGWYRSHQIIKRLVRNSCAYNCICWLIFWSWSCADSFPQRPQHIFLAAILVIVKTFTTGILRCMNEEKGLPLTRQKESRSSSPTLGPKANKNNANASTITKAAGNARSNHRYCESGQARQTNRNKLFCIVCIWFRKRYPN